MESSSSMCKYYRDMNVHNKCCIYNSFLNDYHRQIITRWRLYNHNLKISTGRYSRPIVDHADRKCEICNVIEDEYHSIFVCPLYKGISVKYNHLTTNYSISQFLNPNYNNMKVTECFLHEIEGMRN